MATNQAGCGWGQCPGCGRERRLAGDGTVCAHNRWDSLSWSMTACEGSGRLPAPHPADRSTGLGGLAGPGAW